MTDIYKDIQIGWNLISCPPGENSINLQNLQENYGLTIDNDSLWSFENGVYTKQTELKPGYGYWVKVTSNNGSSIVVDLITLTSLFMSSTHLENNLKSSNAFMFKTKSDGKTFLVTTAHTLLDDPHSKFGSLCDQIKCQRQSLDIDKFWYSRFYDVAVIDISLLGNDITLSGETFVYSENNFGSAIDNINVSYIDTSSNRVISHVCNYMANVNANTSLGVITHKLIRGASGSIVYRDSNAIGMITSISDMYDNMSLVVPIKTIKHIIDLVSDNQSGGDFDRVFNIHGGLITHSLQSAHLEFLTENVITGGELVVQSDNTSIKPFDIVTGLNEVDIGKNNKLCNQILENLVNGTSESKSRLRKISDEWSSRFRTLPKHIFSISKNLVAPMFRLDRERGLFRILGNVSTTLLPLDLDSDGGIQINSVDIERYNYSEGDGKPGIYTNVPILGGSGSGAKVTVTTSKNDIISVVSTHNGSGYRDFDTVYISGQDIGRQSNKILIETTFVTNTTDYSVNKNNLDFFIMKSNIVFLQESNNNKFEQANISDLEYLNESESIVTNLNNNLSDIKYLQVTLDRNVSNPINIYISNTTTGYYDLNTDTDITNVLYKTVIGFKNIIVSVGDLNQLEVISSLTIDNTVYNKLKLPDNQYKMVVLLFLIRLWVRSVSHIMNNQVGRNFINWSTEVDKLLNILKPHLSFDSRSTSSDKLNNDKWFIDISEVLIVHLTELKTYDVTQYMNIFWQKWIEKFPISVFDNTNIIVSYSNLVVELNKKYSLNDLNTIDHKQSLSGYRIKYRQFAENGVDYELTPFTSMKRKNIIRSVDNTWEAEIIKIPQDPVEGNEAYLDLILNYGDFKLSDKFVLISSSGNVVGQNYTYYQVKHEVSEINSIILDHVKDGLSSYNLNANTAISHRIKPLISQNNPSTADETYLTLEIELTLKEIEKVLVGSIDISNGYQPSFFSALQSFWDHSYLTMAGIMDSIDETTYGSDTTVELTTSNMSDKPYLSTWQFKRTCAQNPPKGTTSTC